MLAAAEIPNILPFSPSLLWWLVPIVVIIAVVGIAIPRQSSHRESRRRSSGGDAPRLFVAKEHLLSERELNFLRVLEPLAGEMGLRVCPQVRLEDVIAPDGRAANQFGTRQTIRGMHLDFVLVEAETFHIRAGVELQDSTHETKRRREADWKKARAMEAAGVPLLVYRSARELHRQSLAAV